MWEPMNFLDLAMVKKCICADCQSVRCILSVAGRYLIQQIRFVLGALFQANFVVNFACVSSRVNTLVVFRPALTITYCPWVISAVRYPSTTGIFWYSVFITWATVGAHALIMRSWCAHHALIMRSWADIYLTEKALWLPDEPKDASTTLLELRQQIGSRAMQLYSLDGEDAHVKANPLHGVQ
jgi:hypothetical protein